MAFGARKTSELLITESDQVDLSKASYAQDLTFTALDEETTTFTVTMDRIHFRKPLDIIIAVLEANGFAANFENLLSCFDTLVHGVRIKAVDKPTSSEGPHTPRSFIPCLNFQLPAKHKVGYLLKKFYADIESYEMEIARLRTGELDDSGNKKQSREQLKKELERLQTDNGRLQNSVNQLTLQLSLAMKSQAHVTKALESNNIIPPQLKPVTVREVSLQDRTVTMKAGRSTHVVPMHYLKALPKVGDPCLLNIKDDRIIDTYFYESAGREFQREMAEVLHVMDQSCKVRDSKRRTHIWTAKHESEADVLRQLQRGSKVVLYSIDDFNVKLSPVAVQKPEFWTQIVHEHSTIFQVERAMQSSPNTLPLFKGKD